MHHPDSTAGGVVVIGIEPGWTGRVVDGIAKTGKRVEGFALERNGEIKTVADASRVAQEMIQDASEQQREQCEINELWVSVKCGESDTTSGIGSRPRSSNTRPRRTQDSFYSTMTPLGPRCIRTRWNTSTTCKTRAAG